MAARINLTTKRQENIITLFQKGDKSIDKKVNRDIVLLLGNTGSGKSSLAQYIAGNLIHLTAVKRGTDYVLIDSKGKVSGKSTIMSQTQYPDLIEDSETHTIIYDCPGFSDTRSAAHEITATYFTKKIIDSARSVKLVFTVNHSSLRAGNDRNDFMALLKHATSLIKNITKFKNSIMLVVTKVEQLAETDDEIISSIAAFIERVKSDLEQNDFSSYDENFHTQAIEFIDAIITNTNGHFQKIGIFKRPKAIGKLSTIGSYTKERDSLNKILKDNIQYTKVGNDDFDFTVSDRTKNNISKWVDEVYKDIILELAEAEKQIIEHFEDREQFYHLKLTEVKSFYSETIALFSQIENDDTSTPQEFIEKLIKVIKKLKINIALKSLFSINNHENYLSFLYLFSKQSKPKNRLSYLSKGLSNANKYLDESIKWYNFLYSFYCRLSDYSIQADTSKYNVIAVEEKINQQNESVQFKDIQNIIQDIIDDSKIKIELFDVRGVILNKYKLTALTNILKFSLGNKLESICSGNTLTIQGHYIKLSDVDKIVKNCRAKIKIIEILCLHKIFFDANLNKKGEKLGLIIISPMWDIINDSEIKLDGASGESISLIKDHETDQTDLDGKPGNSGGPAGTFFGIGKTFLWFDKHDLLISAVGGNGENGGNGRDGKDGEDGIGPDEPTCKENFYFTNCFEEWEKKKLIIKHIISERRFKSSPGSLGEFYSKANYIIYGRNGTKGGDGGNAGAGGVGGNGGRITIIGLNGNSDIKTKEGKGKNGEDGKPGTGGKGGKNSGSMHITCSQGYTAVCQAKKIIPYGGTSSPGNSGEPANKNNIEDMNSLEIVTFEKQYSLSINKFKNYLRSNLKNSLNGTFLIDFYNELENHERVINCYDVLSLTDELKGLESQYYALHKEIPLLPFYNSLLKRIASYAKKLHLVENSAQQKRVLWYLNATILSKLSSVNNSFDSKLVVDMKAYLDSIEKNINELKESYDQDKINRISVNYKGILDNKTNYFNQFITAQIKPDIEEIIKQIMNNLRTVLVKEIDSLKMKVTEEKDQLTNKQKELERIFAKKKVIDALQIASYFLLSLSGIGITATAIIEQGITISKSFALEESSFPDIEIKIMSEGMTEISKMIGEKNELLFEQLSDVNQELISFQTENSPKTLKDAHVEIKYALETLEKNRKEDEYPEEIEAYKEKVSEILESIIEEFKSDNSTSTKKNITLKTLCRIKNILIIDPDLFHSFKEDKSQIDLLGNAISQADSTLREITLYHETIYKIIISKFSDFRSEIQKILKAKKEKSDFSIEVSKYKIQNTINDFFTYIHKMTKGFDVEEKISSCIKKLQEGMMTIIDIYKNIENYQSEKQLYTYLNLINSKKSHLVKWNDGEYNNAVDQLDTLVKSNLVLSQYQKAISMFKQYIFPFAHFYLSEFSLPKELQPESNESLVLFAVNNLLKLKTRILESNISIGSFDKHINSDIPFSGDSNQSPFFIWSYDRHKNAIKKLLEGKEIFLEADITKIHSMNAVKFNVIGLKFKASDKSIQGNLDKKLENFQINLTHLGSSNYRCGDTIYIIKHDKIPFKFSLKTSDGLPITRNNVYDKIKNKDFMLSPYTMWSVTLNNDSGSFDDLKEFKEHEISLELQGRGQYVDEEINKSVCVDDMKNYYTVNEILFDTETVEETCLNCTIKDEKNLLINRFDYKREKRQIKDINFSIETGGETLAKNGGSSIFGESFINNIFNFASKSFESFRYSNPLIYINSWFELPTIYDTYNPLWKLLSINKDDTSVMRDQTLTGFHGNLLFWDFFLKKYLRIKNNRKSCNKISRCYLLENNERHSDFASSLAYNYYFNKYNKN